MVDDRGAVRDLRCAMCGSPGRNGGRGAMWIAAMLLVPAIEHLWLDWGEQFSRDDGFGEVSSSLWINVLALAVMALVSVWIERRHAVMHPMERRERRGHQLPSLCRVDDGGALSADDLSGLFADYLGDSFALQRRDGLGGVAGGGSGGIGLLVGPGHALVGGVPVLRGAHRGRDLSGRA